MFSCFELTLLHDQFCLMKQKIILTFSDQRHLRSKDKDMVVADVVRLGREPYLWK